MGQEQTVTYDIKAENKTVWRGEALSVHLSIQEQIAGNNICWVRHMSFQETVIVALDRIPAVIVMERDHTLWLGKVTQVDQLWKFKPKGAKV